MTYIRRLLQVTVVALLAAQAACSSPDPNLYTIAPVSAPALTGAPKLIELRQIGLARYLERNQIVRSSTNYRLDVMSNDWWGEPLGAMLMRVLVEELRQRLPASTIYAETGALELTPDATIEVDVSGLDQDSAGTLVLQAQAAVMVTRRGRPETRSFRFDVKPPGPGTAGEVAAISTAVGQLADGIAVMLTTPEHVR